ncbi:hypothetical protein K438DRAFT_1665755 [Mycena galopus ATCC 62051]|nr:hypothetical protein K438DRAFT_1665755 [Mycena galopus ATCC 62051]
MAAPPPSTVDGRDPDLYIEDGNVVLSAKDNENKTTYFRIHKSTLVKHSPEVFGSMFGIPPPPTLDKYDGVPLVEMPDDAKALRDFLTILYDPQCLPAILDAEDFTSKMLGPTELAKKYQVDWICKLVASQLQKLWPTTLVAWETIAKEEKELCIRGDGRMWIPEYGDDSPRLRHLPEPVSSIILARLCDVPEIIPPAFLHLLRFPFEPNEDDEHYQYLPPFYPWLPPARALLSQADWERLGFARQRIGKWFSRWGRHPWQDCGSGMRCEANTLGTWLGISRDICVDGNAMKVEHRLHETQKNADICSECMRRLQNEFYTFYGEFFDKLAYFFQLEDEE